MRRKLYGKGINASCSYCEIGKISSDKKKVFCHYKGIVPIDYSCRKFKYDPLKRIPKAPLEIEKYSKEDFSIDN